MALRRNPHTLSVLRVAAPGMGTRPHRYGHGRVGSDGSVTSTLGVRMFPVKGQDAGVVRLGGDGRVHRVVLLQAGRVAQTRPDAPGAPLDSLWLYAAHVDRCC